MAAGKVLAGIGGVLTLIGTFVTSWFTYKVGSTSYLAYGVGGVKSVINVFTNSVDYASIFNIPSWGVFILVVVIIAILTAGLTQLGGIKSRGSAAEGGIIALLLGIFILLNSFSVSFVAPYFQYLTVFGDTTPLVSGWIPFSYTLMNRPEMIGTYLITVGGLLALISAFMSRD
jgi:hypothetical protein